MYYSQSSQDKWVCEKLNYKHNGYYVDVGAYDGIQTSNTFIFEKEYSWHGICIEANPLIFKKLCSNRNSININIAVDDKSGECFFDNDKISLTNSGFLVKKNTLNQILIQNKCNSNIDYLSLDIEGNEFVALNSLDFNLWNIKLITVEHNLYLNGPENKNKIFDLLTNKNFERIVDNALCLDKNPLWHNKPYEDWYINKNIIL